VPGAKKFQGARAHLPPFPRLWNWE